MLEISKIDLVRINNGAHFLFMQRVLNRAEADTAVKDKCATQVAALKTAFKEEDEALKVSTKRLLTDRISEADDERDKLYLGLKRVIDGLRIMPLEETATAAGVLWQCIKDYSINTAMQMEKETGLIINLTADLQTKYSAQVKTLALEKYVEALKTANSRVETLTLERTEANMTLVVGRMRLAREASDKAYRALTRMVEAQVMVTGSTDFDGFINYVNAEILRYKREVLGLHATAVPPATGGDDTPGTGGGDGTGGGGDQPGTGGTTPDKPGTGDGDGGTSFD